MPGYFDDNFGEYDIDSEDDVAFASHVQMLGVVKTCHGCKREVRILPHYAYCDPCATRLENGEDF